ncbi:MAG TPA: hypothetical protein VEB22_07490 [Phycisphaerales bacterium]|nr:hypothetical protein [Phycisphaerales bacterium]
MRTPPTFRALAIGVVVAVAATVLVGSATVHFSPRLGRAAVYINFAVAPVVGILALVYYRWVRAYARRHDGEICTGCNYPLKGLAAPGNCPECGRPFGPDRHRSFWSRYL